MWIVFPQMSDNWPPVIHEGHTDPLYHWALGSPGQPTHLSVNPSVNQPTCQPTHLSANPSANTPVSLATSQLAHQPQNNWKRRQAKYQYQHRSRRSRTPHHQGGRHPPRRMHVLASRHPSCSSVLLHSPHRWSNGGSTRRSAHQVLTASDLWTGKTLVSFLKVSIKSSVKAHPVS